MVNGSFRAHLGGWNSMLWPIQPPNRIDIDPPRRAAPTCRNVPSEAAELAHAVTVLRLGLDLLREAAAPGAPPRPDTEALLDHVIAAARYVAADRRSIDALADRRYIFRPPPPITP
jgi:hypothetical protein